MVVSFMAAVDEPGRLQLFHATDGAYSEHQSDWFDLSTRLSEQAARIPADESLRLRLDPPVSTTTRVCGLAIDGVRAEFRILQVDELRVNELQARSEEHCLALTPHEDARDPKVAIGLAGATADRANRGKYWFWVSLGAAVLAVLVLLWVTAFLRTWLRPIAERMSPLPGYPALAKRMPWITCVLMLAFGLGYLVLTPPGAVPDEAAHLAKIIRVQAGVPFGDSGDRPLPNPHAMYGPFVNFLGNKAPFTTEQLAHRFNQPLACEGTSTALPPGANGYFPHQYLLPVLVFHGACITGASFGSFLYLARLLNLLLAAALVTWGVAAAGRGRWALLTVALLPMSLFQMSSISADSLALSLSIAWLGLVSGVASGNVTVAWARAGLFGLGLAIAFLKPGSAWILVCFLFCRHAWQASAGSWPKAVVAYLAVPWMIHVVWTIAAAGDAPALAGVDPEANKRLLVESPGVFGAMLLNTFTGQHLLLLFQRMVGVLGWLDVPLSAWTYWLAGGALTATLWTRDDECTPSGNQWTAPLALSLAAGSLLLIALPLFLYWTPTGLDWIRGLQGRYFLPTVGFVLTWCCMRMHIGPRSLLVALIIVTLAAINLDALWRVMDAYYITGRG